METEYSQFQFDLLYTLVDGIMCELDFLKVEIVREQQRKTLVKQILMTALEKLDKAQAQTQQFLDAM